MLARTIKNVPTPYGEIAVKMGRWEGNLVTAAPEYDACRAAAERYGVPLKAVYGEAAKAAWDGEA